jgi:3-deoxy-D-manno-octulosonate 8-phosphate phosphatase (KDO 8-P phosphatase)
MQSERNYSEILKNIEYIFFDFDGVFTTNKVIVDETGKESVICDRSDGIGLSRARGGGIKMSIVSTEINPVVAARAKKLQMAVYQGVENKLELVKQILEEQGVAPANAVFVGNDINDIASMRYVGCSVAPADAYPEVKKICNILLEKKGGDGAVREICDLVCIARSIKSKYEFEAI